MPWASAPFFGCVVPQGVRQLRRPAAEPVVVIRVGVHHTQDFQDGVREVGVPAAGSEADLAERLTVVEARLLEGLRFAMKP